jgi:hypothetical protein
MPLLVKMLETNRCCMDKFSFAAIFFSCFLLFSPVDSVSSQTLISLKGKKALIKKPKFYIAEIIDARSDKEFVGIVQRGMNNKQEPAQFKGGLQEELGHCLAKYLQSKPGLTPLIVRVLKLNIFERTLPTSETAIAEVILEFYHKSDQGLVLIKSAGSTVTSYGIDVTRSHPGNISLSVQDCLSQVNAVLSKEQPTVNLQFVEYKKLFDTPDILKENDYPIVKNKPLSKGVYRNFIEFRDNAPGITGFSFREKSNPIGNEYDATRGVIKSKGEVLENVWGYCDGQQIFIKVGEEFFEVFQEEGIFWFEGYDISDFRTKVNAPGRSLLMGAFTGFFFYQVQSSWNSKRMKYAINLGNGDLFPLN